MRIPKLNKDDYLNHDEEFWMNVRKELTKELFSKEDKLEKTPENICKLANEIGVKPTARYFNIQPKQVRYYRDKINKNKAN